MSVETVPTGELLVRLTAENTRLKKAIEDFGKNPAGFDWAVLEKLDALEAENAKLKEDFQSVLKNNLQYRAKIDSNREEIDRLTAENKAQAERIERLEEDNRKLMSRLCQIHEDIERALQVENQQFAPADKS